MHNSLADNFLLEEELAEISLIIHKNKITKYFSVDNFACFLHLIFHRGSGFLPAGRLLYVKSSKWKGAAALKPTRDAAFGRLCCPQRVEPISISIMGQAGAAPRGARFNKNS